MAGFWQRLTQAVNYAITGGKALATVQPTWENDKPDYSPVSFESMVKHGYRQNELIFACIDKTAKTAASVHLEIRDIRTQKPVLNNPLTTLLEQPNPFMTESDFWAAVIIYQKLAGNAYFEKERARNGQVIRLWPLRPDWVAPIRSSTSFIGGYKYTVPGMEPITLRADDVLDFRLFDPLNLYRGYPPVAVAARIGDVDNATTDYLKLFFEGGGMPPGILTTKQKLIDTQVEDIRRRWKERYGGFEKWTDPAVLDSDATYQPIGFSFKDMGFDVLDSRNESRICMVLDVPPILVGAKIGLDRATYSNYGEARRAWWQDSLIPLYVSMQDTIETGLVPEFGSNITAAWDFSEVPALQEEVNARWTRATAAWAANAITRNQFQEEIGQEALGPEGEVYLRDTEPAPVVMPVAPEPDDSEEDDEPEDEAPAKSFKARGLPPDDDERHKFEAQWEKVLAAYLRGSLDRMADEIETRYQPVIVKAGENGSAS